MQRWWILTATLLLMPTAQAGGQSTGTSPPPPIDPAGAELLARYCADCHEGDTAEGDIDVAKLTAAETVDKHLAAWDKLSGMVQSQTMPPADSEQPTANERLRIADYIQARLATYDCVKNRRVPRVTIQRLNRREYNNTVRDLLGIEFRPGDDFPSDDVGHGFDNIGEVLSVSPILVEKYLDAAGKIVEQALGDERLRRRIVICRPSESLSREQCQRRIIREFASRAFRRPAEDDEVERLMLIARRAEQRGRSDLEQLSFALQAVLVSPHFLFRIEADPDPEDEDGIRALNDFELASRLSYFLWSSMPDEDLFAVAREGRLTAPDELRRQVHRMLAHPNTNALVENFGGQWLTLRVLDSVQPDPQRFPGVNDQLRQAMKQETLLLFSSVLRENRSVLEFLDADYTYVNAPLARHYGLDGVEGDEFRRVSLDAHRRGVLTHASILTLTSNPTRTSPVKRGKWILDNLLDSPPPPPPPDVADLAEEGDEQLLGTLRERMEQHRADPACATCHRQMDALGFGLENFDAVGAWRERDGSAEIDPSGDLPGSGTFHSAAELAVVLRNTRSDEFARCLTRKLLIYALGRGLEPHDRCTIDAVMKHTRAGDFRLQDMIAAIVSSEPFMMRGR